jgi:hypothetical protein
MWTKCKASFLPDMNYKDTALSDIKWVKNARRKMLDVKCKDAASCSVVQVKWNIRSRIT